MTSLILVRHGATAGEKNTYYGWQDVPLSLQGLEQSENIVKHLSKTEIAAVFSSDLQRAQDLGKLIARESELPLLIDERIREMNFGEWEGRASAELFKEEKFQKWLNNILEETPPRGESLTALAQRTADFLQMIINNYQGRKVVIVSHYGALKTLLLHLCQMNLQNFWSFHLDIASISIVNYNEQKAKLFLLNDLCHLGELDAHLD